MVFLHRSLYDLDIFGFRTEKFLDISIDGMSFSCVVLGMIADKDIDRSISSLGPGMYRYMWLSEGKYSRKWITPENVHIPSEIAESCILYEVWKNPGDWCFVLIKKVAKITSVEISDDMYATRVRWAHKQKNDYRKKSSKSRIPSLSMLYPSDLHFL